MLSVKRKSYCLQILYLNISGDTDNAVQMQTVAGCCGFLIVFIWSIFWLLMLVSLTCFFLFLFFLILVVAIIFALVKQVCCQINGGFRILWTNLYCGNKLANLLLKFFLFSLTYVNLLCFYIIRCLFACGKVAKYIIHLQQVKVGCRGICWHTVGTNLSR